MQRRSNRRTNRREILTGKIKLSTFLFQLLFINIQFLFASLFASFPCFTRKKLERQYEKRGKAKPTVDYYIKCNKLAHTLEQPQ